ncbi:MAG: hypothetical protein V3U76_16630 [Granulosicoccus sp.]
MSLKNKLFIALFVISSSAFALPAHAAKCGEGYVGMVSEGSFGENNLFVQLVNSSGAVTTTSGYKGQPFIRFSDTLITEQINSIRALAYLALANGNYVELWSKGSQSCTSELNEIKLFRAPPNS